MITTHDSQKARNREVFSVMPCTQSAWQKKRKNRLSLQNQGIDLFLQNLAQRAASVGMIHYDM